MYHTKAIEFSISPPHVEEGVPIKKPASLKAVGEHIFYISLIRLADEVLFSEIPLSLCAFFGQDVVFIRFIVNYLFLSRHFEPLLGAFVCL